MTDVIQDQASHLAELTNRLLRTAKLETGETILRKRPIALSDVIEAALSELRIEADVDRVQITFHGEAGTISLDESLIQMAIVQLVSNALKYSPGGTPVRLNAGRTTSALEISVHNHGTYIPPAERVLVFERYYRSPAVEHSAPGTGIGLSVTKRAIEAHGGHIWIESDPKHGTTFRISIPTEENDS